jgi:hypothetical protein
LREAHVTQEAAPYALDEIDRRRTFITLVRADREHINRQAPTSTAGCRAPAAPLLDICSVFIGRAGDVEAFAAVLGDELVVAVAIDTSFQRWLSPPLQVH